MEDRLAWLHVSDFHLRAGVDPFSQDEATRALLEDIPDRVETPLSFVVVTGDLAFSGTDAEYEVASSVLLRLSAEVGVAPDRFFLVPGNHDVDRSKEQLAFNGARAALTTEAQVDWLLGDSEQLEPLLRRQGAFWRFVDDFTDGQDRLQTQSRLGYVAPFDAGSIRLTILGLNSSWMCGEDGEGMRLLIGERQVMETLRLSEDHAPNLRIALAHHPVSWLTEWDQGACDVRLWPSVEIFQRGHLHRPEVVVTRVNGKDCVAIAAGSSHTNRHYENSYNIVELDLSEGQCLVRSFRYVPSRGGFEAEEPARAALILGVPLPGAPSEWALAFSEVEGAGPYAGYLAGLITRYQDEIPVRLGVDGLRFVASEAALRIAPGPELQEMEAFLRLRNRLRLYDADVSVTDRVAAHRDVVVAVAQRLSLQHDEDASFAEGLMHRTRMVGEAIASSSKEHRPQALTYLKELRHDEYWPELERAARKYSRSDDQDLAVAAARMLTETLMRSDEGERRQEAHAVAQTLVDRGAAGPEDYLLAAASAEVVGKDDDAILLASKAIGLWPGNVAVERYVRDLATRTGDVELRAKLEGAS